MPWTTWFPREGRFFQRLRDWNNTYPGLAALLEARAAADLAQDPHARLTPVGLVVNARAYYLHLGPADGVREAIHVTLYLHLREDARELHCVDGVLATDSFGRE